MPDTILTEFKLLEDKWGVNVSELSDAELLIISGEICREPHYPKHPYRPYELENFSGPGEYDRGWGMVRDIGVFWNPLTQDSDAVKLLIHGAFVLSEYKIDLVGLVKNKPEDQVRRLLVLSTALAFKLSKQNVSENW